MVEGTIQVRNKVSLGVSTVEINQNWDWDVSICWDQLLKPVKIFSTVEANFFFVSVKIVKFETFQSRLCHVHIFVEIVKIFKIKYFQLRLCHVDIKVSTDWEISTRKCKNPLTSRSRSRQTVKKCRNFQISTNFLISIETFWSGHWCQEEIKKSQSRFLDCRDKLFETVKIFSTVETNLLT